MEVEYLVGHYQRVKLLKKTVKKEVWLLKNALDGQLLVGKIQPFAPEGKQVRSVLHEAKMFQTMQGHLGIPFLQWAGKDESQALLLSIMQQLGDTVDDKFNRCKPFSLQTTCMLGIRMIQMIRELHQKYFLHTNLKLNSFQFGVGRFSNELYFNDLFYNSKVKNGEKKRLLSKKRFQLDQFMSFDRMIGYQETKKDDLESIVLILIFLLKGKLPWSTSMASLASGGFAAELEFDSIVDTKNTSISKQITSEDTLKLGRLRASREEREQIMHKIITKVDQTSLDQICAGLPAEFRRMLAVCRRMQYTETPDYLYFIRSLKRVLLKNNLSQDGCYDWLTSEKCTISSRAEDLNFHLQNQQMLLQKIYFPFCHKIELT